MYSHHLSFLTGHFLLAQDQKLLWSTAHLLHDGHVLIPTVSTIARMARQIINKNKVAKAIKGALVNSRNAWSNGLDLLIVLIVISLVFTLMQFGIFIKMTKKWRK
jgi:hypothetical protein